MDYSKNTVENQKHSQNWMGSPGVINSGKPKAKEQFQVELPENVCPMCKKELKNKQGKELHMRMSHKEE